MFPFPSSSEISFDHSHGGLHNKEQSPWEETVEKVEENQKIEEFSTNFNGDIEETGKKISRKESEKQRRQKMGLLFTKLRSMLPLESLKGKRSVSDLVNEAENYITRLRRKIEELSSKSENLKSVAKFSSSSSQMKTSAELCSQISVEVRHCWGGVEIMMSDSYRNGGFNLCKVLKLLLQEDMEVHSLASTKVKDKLFHTLQLKFGDQTSLNLYDLQRKLYEMCSSDQQ